MAAGLVDEARAGVIAQYTRSLSPDDAALADGILAAVAPALRLDQLLRKAAALEMKLAPEAVKARREHARRTRQRVEVRREESGNASVAGREMDTADALASRAHIHALALRLRRAGTPGTLDQLRVLVFADLTAGRDPLDRLTRLAGQDETPANTRNPETSAPTPGDPASATPDPGPEDASAGQPDDDGVPPDGDHARDGGVPPDYDHAAPAGDLDPGDVPPPEAPGYDGAEAGDATQTGEHDTRPGLVAGSADRDPGSGRGPASLDYSHDDENDRPGSAADPRPPVPMPATINLVVHAGTLFGWDTTPSEAGGWGLLDAGETRAIVAAASLHPATRWCFTLLDPDGTAAAHACSPGQHPWTPHGHQGTTDAHDQRHTTSAPDQHHNGAGTADPDGTGTPLSPHPPGPQAPAGPANSTGQRTPTPAHLVRARTATCDAPGCTAQAIHADLDHTLAYPDGATEQCNLSPKCRRHHKAKQAPDWKVEQPEPGVICWTLPSGRTHTTRPTVYDLGDLRSL